MDWTRVILRRQSFPSSAYSVVLFPGSFFRRTIARLLRHRRQPKEDWSRKVESSRRGVSTTLAAGFGKLRQAFFLARPSTPSSPEGANGKGTKKLLERGLVLAHGERLQLPGLRQV